ncbi:hypothetical protein AOB60_00905 [Streptomyces noursei]|uniref:Mucin-19 n=1 Tax=Streptomyces noursei TaxID=1971 RepID=A0A2N8PRF3_STRNR|nr:hypothetical protein AOB60_00905 [Streptomyces noursei]
MDLKVYNEKLVRLRDLRPEIASARKAVAKAERELGTLTAQRDQAVAEAAGYEKANASRLAKAAGMGQAEVVEIAPHLDPTPAALRKTHDATGVEQADTAPSPAAPEPPAGEGVVQEVVAPEPAVAATLADMPSVPPQQVEMGASDMAPAPASGAAVPSNEEPSVIGEMPARVLPSLPEGAAAARFLDLAPTKSTRPNFKQEARHTVFLDTDTGDLVARDQRVRVQLGSRSPGEILDAIMALAPQTQRIYVTAGAPWHRDEARYSTKKDAVMAWLNIPSPRWTADKGRGKDTQAGHFVRPNTPVGRYKSTATDRKPHGIEIRSIHEWFDPEGADPAVVRDAFRGLWKALVEHWNDVVLMGSPAQTGRDLWTRTIPTTGRWAGGYPVLSAELRGLIHATAGQGRVELLTPPRVPDELPALIEYDRTFAYAKHCWRSPVGEPRRLTGTAFRTLADKEKEKALRACSHWQVRVTVPTGWDHIGLLPAPAPGERDWHYPATVGATFTTWASGPEVFTAWSRGWKIEVLDGLVWQEGKPLDEWATRLKAAWAALRSRSELHGDPRERTVAYLASRAIRAILLHGVGAFAARPGMVTGTTPEGEQLPDGVEILGQHDGTITWQRRSDASDERNSHPEFAMYVYGSARNALLEMKMRGDDAPVYVGALHVPAGSVVAVRVDAIYLTEDPRWPYHGQPGEYLKKGHLVGPMPHPRSEDDLLRLRNEGRRAHRAAQAGAIS